MGRIAAIGDPASLAQGILDVLSEPGRFKGDREAIRSAYDPDAIAARYEELFDELLQRRSGRVPASSRS
jgi:glycosyltransferase involved in cell wall biosynthesis